MAPCRKSRMKRPANRFYYSAKVSEYQFKRVLWAFVLDQPVAEAARHIDLSANSIAVIYQKVRVYFTELGVFEDIYRGGDPRSGTSEGEDMEGFEYQLLSFHLQRVKSKRRQKTTTLDEVDYNWCESTWRFHYYTLTDGRSSDTVYRMMFSHLIVYLKLCGPIGLLPIKTKISLSLQYHQMMQRVIWLERNSIRTKDASMRNLLREFRSE